MPNPNQAPGSQGDPHVDRAAQWAQDRTTESAPLPFADKRRYENAGQRQADLNAAEEVNIARAAGELGMTSAEWKQMREELGRSPTARDV